MSDCDRKGDPNLPTAQCRYCGGVVHRTNVLGYCGDRCSAEALGPDWKSTLEHAEARGCALSLGVIVIGIVILWLWTSSSNSRQHGEVSSDAMNWYVVESGQPTGPHNRDAVERMVASGRINAATKVCVVGGTAWNDASQDPMIAALMEQLGEAPTD